jgi:flagellar motility protein MotE (MotC chaperone)
MRLRIIPLTIVVASFFLMIKMVALIQGGQQMAESLIVSRVEAEPAPEKPAADQVKEEAATDAKPAEGEAKPAEGDKKAEGEKKAEGKEEKKEAAPEENPNISSTPGDIADRRFTTVEVELLQKLSMRREELDKWEANLQIKEAALSATEKRIDEKILQVEAMKKAVSAALAEYNKIEDTEVSSLVKIYENMKPGDAARIFNELERPILLLIVDRMSERKAAPILASMDPKKAKQVTIDLAEQRRIKNNSMNAVTTGTPTAQ